ncbi:MAG: Lrp/AsnC family transcriptional regulator [Acidimicrobiales bacterium]
MNSTERVDETDLALIRTLRASRRPNVAEAARRLGVARGTVHARMARLEQAEVITGYGPEIEPRLVGYPVLAFITLETTQGEFEATVASLAAIPEILEVHTVAGVGDLLCRVVARSNDHLHEVVQTITKLPTVGRSQTNLALASPLQRTLADVL